MKIFKIISLLVLCCLASNSFSQKTITIYGKVTEELTNKPIERVSVKILNSNYGTITASNGMFRLSIPAKKHVTILFSHIAFTKKILGIFYCSNFNNNPLYDY